MAIERTFVILKPDALKRGLVSNIIQYFTRAGLHIIRERGPLWVTHQELEGHFPNNTEWVYALGERAVGRVVNPTARFGVAEPLMVGEIIRNECMKYYREGQIMALILEGEDAVSSVRALLGSALPSKAEKGTIRGDLGEPEDPNSIAATRNLVHASDSVKEAEREIAVWFPREGKSAAEDDAKAAGVVLGLYVAAWTLVGLAAWYLGGYVFNL